MPSCAGCLPASDAPSCVQVRAGLLVVEAVKSDGPCDRAGCVPHFLTPHHRRPDSSPSEHEAGFAGSCPAT